MHNKLSLCSLLITFLHLPVTSTSFSPNKLSPGFNPCSVLSGHVWDTLSASTPFSKKQLFLDCWWKCKMIRPLQRQFGMKINRSDLSTSFLTTYKRIGICSHSTPLFLPSTWKRGPSFCPRSASLSYFRSHPLCLQWPYPITHTYSSSMPLVSPSLNWFPLLA